MSIKWLRYNAKTLVKAINKYILNLEFVFIDCLKSNSSNDILDEARYDGKLTYWHTTN